MAKTMNLKEKKEIAEELFFQTDKSQKEIANTVKVTEKTIGKWKEEGNWEVLRQARTVTSNNIINELYQRAYDLSQKEDIDADKLSKISTTIERLSNKKTTISQIINVFKDFTTFAFGEDPEIAKEINGLMRKYVDTKVNER